MGWKVNGLKAAADEKRGVLQRESVRRWLKRRLRWVDLRGPMLS